MQMKSNNVVKVLAITLALSFGIAMASTNASLGSLEGEALSGSASAAEELAYRSKDDEGARLYWISVGAENGSPSAQFNYWRRLKDHENPLLRERAAYWLKLSAASGDETAIRALERLKAQKD
jgi:hypothetical protein